MKRIHGVAVGLLLGVCLLAGSLFISRTSHAKDVTQPNGDFFFDGIRTDQVSITAFMTQARLAILNGDRHGLGVVSIVPAAPASGVLSFDLSGVGPSLEDASGVVTTVCGDFVTTYPDAGYVTVAVDGGTAQRCLTQTGTVTETDGGALWTFPVPFNVAPTCVVTNTSGSAHNLAVTSTSYVGATVAGTVNTNDVAALICRGYR